MIGVHDVDLDERANQQQHRDTEEHRGLGILVLRQQALDVADGAGTVLFDLAARTWSDEVIEALGLDPAMLPRTVEGPDVVGVVSEAAAAARPSAATSRRST